MRYPLTLATLALASPLAAQTRLFEPMGNGAVDVGPMAGQPVLADMNHDGHLDVVLACGTCCGSKPSPDSGHVMVLLGDGKGGLVPAAGMPIKVGDSVRKVAVADLDGDGKLDVVAAQHESYELVVLRGDGRGGLAVTHRVAARAGTRPHTHAVTLADIDGDHTLDVLTTNANDGDISILRGTGFGHFVPLPASPVRAGRHPYDEVLVCDVNGDGRPDLIAPDLHGGTVTVQLQSETVTFAPAPGTPLRAGPRPGYVALADLDADGDQDLVATHDDDPFVAMWRNDGGRFTVWPGAPLRLPDWVWGIAAGDFDADGHVDLAVSSWSQGVFVLLGAKDGRFALADATPIAVGGGTSYLAAGDLDGDGALDLVVPGYEDGKVHLLRGTRAHVGHRQQLGEFDLAAVAARIAAPSAAAAERRADWIWAIAAGQADHVMALVAPDPEASDAEAWLRAARAHVGRMDACVGGELPVTATAADAAFARALALAPNHFAARFERAMTLAQWPPRAGKTPAAIAEFEALLAAHGADSDARLATARAKLAELRAR